MRVLKVRELGLVIAATEPVVFFQPPPVGLHLGEPLWRGLYRDVPSSLLDRSVSVITAGKKELVIFIKNT